jgi:Fe-Mn family superoxide dismutase
VITRTFPSSRRTWRSISAVTSTTRSSGRTSLRTAETSPRAIDDNFGSFDKFVGHFSAAATSLQGSGWAVLSWDAVGKQLIIQQLFDQQGNTALGTIPILQLDMWEHAFYLDYVNVKADYVKAFWNIVNWADASARFEAARAGAGALLLLS